MARKQRDIKAIEPCDDNDCFLVCRCVVSGENLSSESLREIYCQGSEKMDKDQRREREGRRDRQTERDRERQRERDTERERDRQTDRQTETERDIERENKRRKGSGPGGLG